MGRYEQFLYKKLIYLLYLYTMKVIITETQKKLILENEGNAFFIRKKIAKKYLTKNFGNLTPTTDDRYVDTIFYLDKEHKSIFEFNTDSGFIWIDIDDIWRLLKETFDFNEDQVEEVAQEWIEQNYDLDVNEVHTARLGYPTLVERMD